MRERRNCGGAVRPESRALAKEWSDGVRKRGFFREGTSGKTRKPRREMGIVIMASTMNNHLHVLVIRARCK